MKKIKKGDIVARKSYGKDILFVVKNIIHTNRGEIAILRGIVDRIESDSEIEDLEIVDKQIVKERMQTLKEELEDMEIILKEDYLNTDMSDSEIVGLRGKLKELENQIVKIVENK